MGPCKEEADTGIAQRAARQFTEGCPEIGFAPRRLPG